MKIHHLNWSSIEVSKPHIDSFNYAINEGLQKSIENLIPISITLPTSGTKFVIKLINASIGFPEVHESDAKFQSIKLFPLECRNSGLTYKAPLYLKIRWWKDALLQQDIVHNVGCIPIMVKSSHCNLTNLSKEELIAHGEEENELGGYFIIKGHEKIIRFLIGHRRNYPIAMIRHQWKTRGENFSEFGVLLRSVSEDHTSTTNVLHYLIDGTSKLMLSYKSYLFFIPLILLLKALNDLSDKHLFDELSSGMNENIRYKGCIINMMRELQKKKIFTQSDCKNYIGKHFRNQIEVMSENESNETICDFIIKNCIFIGLSSYLDKFNLLVFMSKKLIMLISDKILPDNGDSLAAQELFLSGELYLLILKAKLQKWLNVFKESFIKKFTKEGKLFNLTYSTILKLHMYDIESSMETFMATGNLSNSLNLEVKQKTGFCINAENINRMRYLSHFKAVHRGQFFMTMRTTEIRKLLPEAWGFICPIHTPDGVSCGLLNYLTALCHVTTAPLENKTYDKLVESLSCELGMFPNELQYPYNIDECYNVMMDGKIIGFVSRQDAIVFIKKLRLLKLKNQNLLKQLEICFFPYSGKRDLYPGIFLFTSSSRMMRPVIFLDTNDIDFIGTLEQIHLNIAIRSEEILEGVSTHIEIENTSFLSNVAQLIPLPEFNQSPRNMYQCQMGKQSIGISCHNVFGKLFSKMYQLLIPQSPLFRTYHYDRIFLDDYPVGMNAVVAVISYTGYDMEDAMILNKASVERGFANCYVYKTLMIDLAEIIKDKHIASMCRFERNPYDPDQSVLDSDGLPQVGVRLKEGMPLYCYFNTFSNAYKTHVYTNEEEAFVHRVSIMKSDIHNYAYKSCIILRIQRKPMVGDKFASRAGQKGICSFLWPAEDLPYTESGMTPDIIFNPHGFPSRMTVAMMIECMAGKCASVCGTKMDATPFKFSEDNKFSYSEYCGSLLHQAGYNYYGTETMYSGTDGRLLEADVYFGIIYYQRLRHMVRDKWQVRSTGPINPITKQPTKGRSRGGGIRFGEMERDSLLSHGASFLLHDRLFHCSDKRKVDVCLICGSLISPIIKFDTDHIDDKFDKKASIVCTVCEKDGRVVTLLVKLNILNNLPVKYPCSIQEKQ